MRVLSASAVVLFAMAGCLSAGIGGGAPRLADLTACEQWWPDGTEAPCEANVPLLTLGDVPLTAVCHRTYDANNVDMQSAWDPVDDRYYARAWGEPGDELVGLVLDSSNRIQAYWLQGGEGGWVSLDAGDANLLDSNFLAARFWLGGSPDSIVDGDVEPHPIVGPSHQTLMFTVERSGQVYHFSPLGPAFIGGIEGTFFGAYFGQQQYHGADFDLTFQLSGGVEPTLIPVNPCLA